MRIVESYTYKVNDVLSGVMFIDEMTGEDVLTLYTADEEVCNLTGRLCQTLTITVEDTFLNGEAFQIQVDQDLGLPKNITLTQLRHV